jgi:hypothetical protein
METPQNWLNKEETVSSGKSWLPTSHWYSTDRIESDASNNSLLPGERLYRIFIQPL